MWKGLSYGIWGVVILMTLAGCTTTGFIDGRFATSGSPPTPVRFMYKTQPVGKGGTMTVTLPTGESFAGKYVQLTSTSTVNVVPPVFWEPGWGHWGPFRDPRFDVDDFSTSVRNYSGQVVAMLSGDRGDTMRCRFTLNSPEQGMRSGGVGACQVSNGGQLTAAF